MNDARHMDVAQLRRQWGQNAWIGPASHGDAELVAVAQQARDMVEAGASGSHEVDTPNLGAWYTGKYGAASWAQDEPPMPTSKNQAKSTKYRWVGGKPAAVDCVTLVEALRGNVDPASE